MYIRVSWITVTILSVDIVRWCLMLIFLIFRVHLVVSGLLPRGQNRFPDCQLLPANLTALNTTATEVNRALAEVLHYEPRATYLAHPQWVTAGTVQRDLLSRDGLHLSPRGAETLAEEITTAVDVVKQVGSYSLW